MEDIYNLIKTLITEKEIQQRAKELGKQITNDYKGEELVVFCVLKGALLFYIDLIKEIDLPITIEGIRIKSYTQSSKGMSSTHKAQIEKILDYNIENKHVLLVEDIIDTGESIKKLKKHLMAKNPKSVECCSMLIKPSIQKKIKPKYVGFFIPAVFVIGYGLDYNEKYRNIKQVGILDTKHFGLDIDNNEIDTFDNVPKSRIETWNLGGNLLGFVDYEKKDGQLILKDFTIKDKDNIENHKTSLLEKAKKVCKEESLVLAKN